jgi:hypothetical protein
VVIDQLQREHFENVENLRSKSRCIAINYLPMIPEAKYNKLEQVVLKLLLPETLLPTRGGRIRRIYDAKVQREWRHYGMCHRLIRVDE